MKRLERSIAFRVMVSLLLVLYASVSRGVLRWVAVWAAIGILGTIILASEREYPERLAITVTEYGLAGGQLTVSGKLANVGTLDLYRPELIFSIEDRQGHVVTKKSAWPTGQIKRNFPVGGSMPFSVSMPAPADPAGVRLLLSCPQYPFALDVQCQASDAVPPLIAA